MALKDPTDQTDRLILFLVQNLTKGVPHLLVEGGGVLTTMLAKLLFLIDVWSVQTTGLQVTNFRYIRYKHGPYPVKQFEERLERLRARGLSATPKVSIQDGKSYRIYRLQKGSKIPFNLSPRTTLLADKVMTTFANRKLEEVLDHVYNLDIIQKVPFGEQIDIALLAPIEKNAVKQVAFEFKRDFEEPLPPEHLRAIELAREEISNENIKTAEAMRERQRRAFQQRFQS